MLKNLKPIIFHNQGELDIRAVTTFGLSVKKNDNPIGYFGTGLKYAIAVLLREGCEIEIYSGKTQFKFYSQKDMFRGEECELIFMDGDDADHHQLPFTMALGRNWELWQAYRELYCNALDEDGGVCDKHEDAEGRENFTIINVRGEAFAEIHRTRNSFINSDGPILTSDVVDIIPTSGAFLKGIKIASNIYYQPLFGYNFHSGVTLTEDRTLKEPMEAERGIRNAVIQANDFDLIGTILKAPEGSFEEQITWSSCRPSEVGETFMRALIDLAKNLPDKISYSAKELAKTLNPTKTLTSPHILASSERSAFDKACQFLAVHGVNVEDYPVIFVETLGGGIWGKADQGQIYIAAECFRFKASDLIQVIILFPNIVF